MLDLKIPHPERILYPDLGISRGEVVAYYAAVADYILDQARGRALTVKRWPHGLAGPMFYQKHPEPGQLITLSDVRDILRWVGRGVLEWHAPLGMTSNPFLHDWAILDLDPNPPAGWPQVVAVAEVVKQLFDYLGVTFRLKTSGQRGLHFYIPIQWLHHDVVKEIMSRWAQVVVHAIPELATIARLKRDRGSRVYLDYLQNTHSRTTVMAYSLRATAAATVSTPILWEEVSHPPRVWTMERVLRHVTRYGDLFFYRGIRLDLSEIARRNGFDLKGSGVGGNN